MKTFTLKNLTKTGTLVSLAALMMGNQGCPQDTAPEARQLRRRVAMGAVTSFAPTIKLPASAGSGTFNFDFAVNAQLQRVLADTKSFSTIGAYYDPSTVSEADKKEFFRCSASNPTRAFEFSEETACMVDMPQAKIDAAITNFQFIGGGGVEIGLLESIIQGISVSYKQARLTMEFKASDPLIRSSQSSNEGQMLAGVSAKSYFEDVSGKVSFGIGAFSLGLGGYMVSDMAKVVEKALSNGLTDLRADYDNRADKSMGLGGGWYAMVMKNCDKGILINAGNGADAGLVRGDIVAIYNTNYYWKGRACNSELSGAMVTTKAPIAYARIVTLGNTISGAEIIEGDPAFPVNMDVKVKPGARVYMKKWAPVAPAVAAK